MESDHKPSIPEEPRSPINPYRAQRELERWLYSGGDEREMSERMSGRGLPSNWRDNATHIMTIVYEHVLNERGDVGDIKISYIRPEDTEENKIPEVPEGE